jgi:isopenicillin N synthase-like dioxygenase
MSDAVPVIDIAPFLAGSPDGRARVVDAMARAAEDIGFFSISGHGVGNDVVDALYREAHAFFDLPLDEKQRVAPRGPDFSRGYKGLGWEALAAGNQLATPPDIKEYYHFGRPDWPAGDPYFEGPEGRRYFARNQWPARPAAFGAVADRYYLAMEALSVQLCRMAALALDLPEHYFDDKIDRHITAMRINFYPRQDNPPAAGQLRAGAHTDYGMLTILSGENVPGGLQVQTRSGEWVDAPTDRYRFTCNIGDLLMRWTNDRWVSNVHRVLNPPEEIARRSSRMSIAFFHHPNYDAKVECIPSCATPEHPAKYPPVLSGEFRDYKYNVTRTQAAA